VERHSKLPPSNSEHEQIRARDDAIILLRDLVNRSALGHLEISRLPRIVLNATQCRLVQDGLRKVSWARASARNLSPGVKS